MNSAIDFFKNDIKDNNFEGISLNKITKLQTKCTNLNTKKCIYDFTKELHSFIAEQDIKYYIRQITFDEEFEASVDQKIFDISGSNFDNLKIYTTNIIGSINYKGKQFNINCRFDENFLQYMIASSSGFLELEKMGSFDGKVGIGEWILIYYWKIQLKKAFALGMYKTYQQKSDSLSAIRGSIDINKYLKKSHTYFDGKTDCNYKEHSYNNAINYIISLALKKVFKNEKYINLVHDIYEIKNAFDTIIHKKINLNLQENHQVLNPFYTKYNEVYELSLKILNDNFSAIGESKQDFSAFLFDISLLFEHHIRKILMQKFELFEKNKKEFQIPNGIGINNVYPDVIIDYGTNKEGKKQIGIYDVKYKNFNIYKGKGVDRNDRFQLVTYVATHLSKYEVVECGFIYPSKNDYQSKNNQTLKICNEEIPFKIYLYKVDNSEDFFAVQQKLDEIFIDFFTQKKKEM